ncbi:MAG: M16 family metallopeptidase [Aridibacter sp.]
MKIYFQKSTFLVLFLFLLTNLSFAQSINFPEPRQDKLLNGLKVLVWNQPKTSRITVKIRVHSGSAFDPQDKMGTMVLLGRILFPEDGIKQFFEEDLEGNLEIINTYDYMQINATAKADEFVSLLETLAPAISNPSIDKEKTAKVKAEHLEKLKELEKNPGYVADRAIAERLLGDFPYGRPIQGTTESVENIDFADLIFAEQRFFNADNTTIAIIGDVNPDFAYKAARRLFGAWKKGDNKVPATFRLPDEPDEAPLIVNVDEENVIENRYAVNAFARNNKDYSATEILTEILNERFKKASEKKGLKSVKVENISNLLRGYIVFTEKYNSANQAVTESDAKSNAFITKLFTEKISAEEFNRAKNKVSSKLSKMDAADFYLDLDSYKLDTPKKELKKIESVMLSDVEKVAIKLSKEKVADVLISSIEKEETTVNPIKNKDPNDPRK